VSTLVLAGVGLGAPGIGLLVARWLTADDTATSMRRYREALAALGEVTGRAGSTP
jgi:hypothetical protein